MPEPSSAPRLREIPRHGEIWMVDFGEPVGHEQGYRRPALVVSADRFNATRAELVIVVPLTRTRRGLPSHVEIKPGVSGLADPSYAKAEDIKSVSTRRLVHRLGIVDTAEMRQISRVLAWLLELS